MVVRADGGVMRAKHLMRAILLLLVVAALAYLYYLHGSLSTDSEVSTPRNGVTDSRRAMRDDQAIVNAFADKRSGVMVESVGIVEKILPDDLQGSRHQRFIIRLQIDHTLLVSHNIDIAPRIPLAEQDSVGFRGQYEWNVRGGVVHWTHHDPDGLHPGGWVRHRGTLYD
jgi:hypothetical protein